MPVWIGLPVVSQDVGWSVTPPAFTHVDAVKSWPNSDEDYSYVYVANGPVSKVESWKFMPLALAPDVLARINYLLIQSRIRVDQTVYTPLQLIGSYYINKPGVGAWFQNIVNQAPAGYTWETYTLGLDVNPITYNRFTGDELRTMQFGFVMAGGVLPANVLRFDVSQFFVTADITFETELISNISTYSKDTVQVNCDFTVVAKEEESRNIVDCQSAVIEFLSPAGATGSAPAIVVDDCYIAGYINAATNTSPGKWLFKYKVITKLGAILEGREFGITIYEKWKSIAKR
jgi:hypothetical protein